MDCEDEAVENAPLEQLAPKLIDMSRQGFAMPTLLIPCAGKKSDGVVKSPSAMRAANALRESGSPIGIHWDGWVNMHHIAMEKEKENDSSGVELGTRRSLLSPRQHLDLLVPLEGFSRVLPGHETRIGEIPLPEHLGGGQAERA